MTTILDAKLEIKEKTKASPDSDLELDSAAGYKFLQSLPTRASTTKELTSIIKEIWQTKLQEQKLQKQARKNALRSKIMMGGLVKKT